MLISKLNGAVVATDKTITVASGTLFPTNWQYMIQIKNERMLVTNVADAVLTVIRGFNGTVVDAYDDGEVVTLMIDDLFMRNMYAFLDAIEAGADVTDATNVDAAGATMNADTNVKANSWVLDEDNMATNDDTKVPTQQSTKAYTDAHASATTGVHGVGAGTIAKTSDITATKLDDFAAPDNNTDLNASIAAHGLCPKGDNDTTHYLRGDMTWATAGGGGYAIFGDGSDGNVTISDNTTLTRDMYYNNLTINSGKTLYPAGYRIFVAGTLTNNGTISVKGGDGTAASGGTKGTGGAAWLSANKYFGSGAAGGNGGTGKTSAGNGSPGVAGAAQSNSYSSTNGAAGVAGGATPTYTSPLGVAGAATTISTKARLNYRTIIDALNLQEYDLTPLHSTAGAAGGGSGSLSGYSGEYTSGAGGGGGSAGGMVVIAAKTLTNNSAITVNGGDGGAGGNAPSGGGWGAGGGGGGSGGNGGLLILIYNTLTEGTVTYAGGTGGTGGTGVNGGGSGSTGNNGAAGLYIKIPNA